MDRRATHFGHPPLLNVAFDIGVVQHFVAHLRLCQLLQLPIFHVVCMLREAGRACFGRRTSVSATSLEFRVIQVRFGLTCTFSHAISDGARAPRALDAFEVEKDWCMVIRGGSRHGLMDEDATFLAGS